MNTRKLTGDMADQIERDRDELIRLREQVKAWGPVVESYQKQVEQLLAEAKRKPTPGIAKAAYEAWCKSWPKGALSHVKWSQLSPDSQCAWVAAAQAVYEGVREI